jgi:hypothetical protein
MQQVIKPILTPNFRTLAGQSDWVAHGENLSNFIKLKGYGWLTLQSLDNGEIATNVKTRA